MILRTMSRRLKDTLKRSEATKKNKPTLKTNVKAGSKRRISTETIWKKNKSNTMRKINNMREKRHCGRAKRNSLKRRRKSGNKIRKRVVSPDGLMMKSKRNV